jgi:hypothetical protein
MDDLAVGRMHTGIFYLLTAQKKGGGFAPSTLENYILKENESHYSVCTHTTPYTSFRII